MGVFSSGIFAGYSFLITQLLPQKEDSSTGLEFIIFKLIGYTKSK